MTRNAKEPRRAIKNYESMTEFFFSKPLGRLLRSDSPLRLRTGFADAPGAPFGAVALLRGIIPLHMGLLTISLVVGGTAPLRATGKRRSGEGNGKTQCNDHRNETFHASPPNGFLYTNANSTIT
jgi:hypothetical protein